MLATNDKALHEDVLEELRLEPRVAAGRIAIAVEQGVVTLSGTVQSFTEKWAAQEAAKHVRGVRGIADELRVELPGMHRRDDADIAKTAVEFLEWGEGLPQIQVEVEDGRVTLTGTVDWSYQRDDAMIAIRKIPGVRDACNAMTIKPRSAKASELQAMIEGRFQRLASLNPKLVEVAVQGSMAQLSGTVRSFAEREQGGNAALSIRGVTEVETGYASATTHGKSS